MAIPSGWPCALLPSTPPTFDDALTDPSDDLMTSVVLRDTPRGAAWGTDEAGDGSGASPIQRGTWAGIAGWLGTMYRAASTVAQQAFPSAITYSLADWEAEYGLPDPCISPASGDAGRIRSVRARFGAVGGSSPAYFICLAASVGYDITITEPSDFICDVSECDGDDTVVDVNGHHEWVVHLIGLGDVFFYPDDGELDVTPLEGFLIATDLECILRRVAPQHTSLIFDYTGVE